MRVGWLTLHAIAELGFKLMLSSDATTAHASHDVRSAWRAGRVAAIDATVPVPLPKHAADPPLPVGPDYLKHVFRRFLSRASAGQRAGLIRYVTDTLSGRVVLGTACSGTDGVVLGWRALSQVLASDCNCPLDVSQAFASERDASKRRFLQTCFPEMPHLFADTTDLGNDVAHDSLRGAEVPVPTAINSFMAGFPCVDASPLNNNRSSSSNRSCLSTGGLSTGSVFHGIWRYLRKRDRGSLHFAMFENVPGLLVPPKNENGQISGPSNADSACYMLSEIGLDTMVWQLCPRLFGVPQSRARLYFLAVDRQRLKDLGLTTEGMMRLAGGYMNALVGSQLQDLASYVLPEGHWLVQRYLLDCAGLGARESDDWHELMTSGWGLVRLPDKDAQQKQGVAAWPAQHMKLFNSWGKDWTSSHGPSQSERQLHPGLRALSSRELEVLTLAGVRRYPEQDMRLVEVSQNAGRGSAAMSRSTTAMVPRGRYYVTNKCRLLVGVEQMRLQSLWFDLDTLAKFDNGLLGDLAGNAFEVSCCSAVFFSALLLLSAGFAEEPLPRAMCETAPEAEECQDDCPLRRQSRKRALSLFPSSQESDVDADCYQLRTEKCIALLAGRVPVHGAFRCHVAIRFQGPSLGGHVSAVIPWFAEVYVATVNVYFSFLGCAISWLDMVKQWRPWCCTHGLKKRA